MLLQLAWQWCLLSGGAHEVVGGLQDPHPLLIIPKLQRPLHIWEFHHLSKITVNGTNKSTNNTDYGMTTSNHNAAATLTDATHSSSVLCMCI